jgi:5'-nucleotidase
MPFTFTTARTLRPLALALSLGALALPSHALNILLTNDDGLTANLKALQSALIAAGHDVIVSVPCQNQSGKGAALSFFSPITPLTTACRNNAAAAGAAGVGAIAGLSDAYYVNGTPVMATLYGLDVLATQRWGGAPDLVVSGPNEGQNVGSIVISSGTVSNAQYALSRGIPAIAVSAGSNTTDNDSLAAEVAALTVKVVDRLDQDTRSARGKRTQALLPSGLGLNMNIPTFSAGGSADLPWQVTRFGNFDAYDVHFVMDLGADPVAASYGLGSVHYPGISLSTRTAADATATTDPKSEALVDLQGAISLTPMQLGYEAPLAAREVLSARLRAAFEHKAKH